ncbi:hypothetical protein [Thiothrix nivea]|uniref:Uncharacterized protein n=1 Tax=Thiothrix nivea (strain ATCC 35100 / DSM 5205 / JP2) TaxID=870187 RepID=A0A656HJ70_THINJ|nr:hypothetical protein [Thiothrix nivea]EIJ35279.1 hypothetical protein Thini_2742 [Thiothrix nivea DSM 5205]
MINTNYKIVNGFPLIIEDNYFDAILLLEHLNKDLISRSKKAKYMQAVMRNSIVQDGITIISETTGMPAKKSNRGKNTLLHIEMLPFFLDSIGTEYFIQFLKGEIAQLSSKETLSENETEEVETLHDMIIFYKEAKTCNEEIAPNNNTTAPKGETK